MCVKIWLVFADVLYQVLTSKKVDHIFSKNKVAYQNSISNYEIIRRIAKIIVVRIYKVMYMVHVVTNHSHLVDQNSQSFV